MQNWTCAPDAAGTKLLSDLCFCFFVDLNPNQPQAGFIIFVQRTWERMPPVLLFLSQSQRVTKTHLHVGQRREPRGEREESRWLQHARPSS